MDFSYYLKNYEPDNKKLLSFGFKETNGVFCLERDLSEIDLCAVIKISNKEIDAAVIDKTLDEEYLPFNTKNGAQQVKSEVEQILNNIVIECFVSVNQKEIVTKYIEEKYQVLHETPWEEYPEYYTFKTPKSKKWFAIIMNIKAKALGLQGENLIDVMNIKLPPEMILCLIDDKQYFKAYHMNKTYWISIIIDKHTDVSKLKELIEVSFNLVESKN